MKKISFQVALLSLLSYLAFMVVTGQENTLKKAPAFNQDLAWSPDGKRIAFISGNYPATGIYIMKTDGKDMTRLIN